LSAGQSLTALRTVMDCTTTATALRHGPASQPGPGVTWIAYLCPAHTGALPEWPGTPTADDDTGMKCGTLLDFRPTEQLLQSHAGLWLTPLTGVDPKDPGGNWAAVIQEADRVLRSRLDEDDPLYNVWSMITFTPEDLSDLPQMALHLSYCEIYAHRALAR
jgi:hypothetical protein